jgi:uracil-DNA glycosylase
LYIEKTKKMSDTVDLEQVKHGLYQKLKPSGWADKLKTFMLSAEMDNILKQLLKETEARQRFTPVIKQVFRAFELCPYGELKVVMLGQDPYPYPGVCDGLAFSCGNTGHVQPSLRYIFKEIEDTIVHPDGYTWDPDLGRWAKQGILLINTALTTTVNQVGQHYILWRPFLGFLFDVLTAYNPGLVYVFLGKKAQEWAKSIPENNHKIFVVHPAAAAHTRAERWDSDDLFNKINVIMHKTYGQKITW